LGLTTRQHFLVGHLYQPSWLRGIHDFRSV
jgi:hypothetical protein